MKITVLSAKDFGDDNGLEEHARDIAKHGLEAPPGLPWTGYAVVKLRSPSTERDALTGLGTAKVVIEAIELMQDHREDIVRHLMAEVRKARLEAGSLVDPEVVGEGEGDPLYVGAGDPFDGPVTPTVARGMRRTDTDFDRYEDPDANPRYAGQPITSVELPGDEGDDPPRLDGETDREYDAALDAMREGEQVGPYVEGRAATAAAKLAAPPKDWSPADDVGSGAS